jgi:hypothetical protein
MQSLVNGDSWRQTLNDIDIRLVHLAKKLSRIGAERLNITTLPFGINGVEGQTAFSAS